MKHYLSILLTLVLTACGGGGGSNTTPESPKAVVPSLSEVALYQNANQSPQVFNTQVADLNNDGLEDVVVSGWAMETTPGLHGKIPVKIFIQQTDGTLKDQTDTLLGAGNNMIWGNQRAIIADFDNDNKLDIFLGGFQDGYCSPCTYTNSVMLWNTGTGFTRYDFSDSVWAHNVCTGDLNNDGLLDIVAGENFYINNSNRNFTVSSSQPHPIGWGDCAIIKDPSTGNNNIISTNINYVVQGYTGIIHTYDSNLNWVSVTGLPGSDGGSHDIVNTIKTDLNNDGLDDLILTDNKSNNRDGKFVALINNGTTFTDQTATYFPLQTNNYYFQYYYRFLSINGAKHLFVDVVDSSWNFSTLPQLWKFNNSYEPNMFTQLSELIGSYTQPTMYKTSSGKINLLLIKPANNKVFTFYTKPV